MFKLSFSQAIPGPVVPMVIPSNLYAGFKDEFIGNLKIILFITTGAKCSLLLPRKN
jgi:hypothetical protein